MMMTVAAASTSSAATASGLGRKLMKGLQTENRLQKNKNSPNQPKMALDSKKLLKMDQNGSKLEVAAMIFLAD